DIVIFRFDRSEVETALAEAVERGVAVRALIAHTNKGGEKTLRKLEVRLLEAGATVARTGDDLARYHGKMMIIDGVALHVYGLNYNNPLPREDDDHRRARPPPLRLQLPEPRHRAQPQLRHRHARQGDRAGGDEAV